MSRQINFDHSVSDADIDRATANVMNRGKDAFIAYNVSGDCIRYRMIKVYLSGHKCSSFN